MPFSQWLKIVVLVVLAGAVTTFLGAQLANLSVIQKIVVMDATKAGLALLIIFLCLRMLVLTIRK